MNPCSLISNTDSYFYAYQLTNPHVFEFSPYYQITFSFHILSPIFLFVNMKI